VRHRRIQRNPAEGGMRYLQANFKEIRAAVW